MYIYKYVYKYISLHMYRNIYVYMCLYIFMRTYLLLELNYVHIETGVCSFLHLCMYACGVGGHVYTHS